MDVVTWLLYRRESRLDSLREKHLRPYGKDPAHALVRRVADAADSDAGSSGPNGAGIAVHYGLGMGPGALYAHRRRQYPWLRVGRGAGYGLALYLLNDLLAARLLGIAGPQRAYPWQAHARGVVGHVVLGMVTEATLNAVEDGVTSR
jgi:uncharacterized membrane protein YagU involved in acid resistance